MSIALSVAGFIAAIVVAAFVIFIVAAWMDSWK